MSEMNITLVHPSKDILSDVDVDEFFKTDNAPGIVNTVNSFCYKIKKYADKYADSIKTENFKGGMFELFAEYLCKTHESDNRVGIYNYSPVPISEDFGVDGLGYGVNQHPATVQAKFRAGDYVLHANKDHLTNFLAFSQNKYGVRLDDDKNMLIITTGLRVNYATMENMLHNKVRVLNREALREMLDNRLEWWIRFYDVVQKSRTPRSEIVVVPVELRQHQKEAVELVRNMVDTKGKIVLPTGTGKTLIEAEIIRETILKCQSKGELAVIKINSPRILLCFQLFEEIFKRLSSLGINAAYVNYNSGQQDTDFYETEIRKNGGIYQELVSTTSVLEMQDSHAKAIKANLPLIIFSTYHSSEKFVGTDKIPGTGIIPTLTIHDEAHNLVSNAFRDITDYPSGSSLYFTATEKVTDTDSGINVGYGMNNAEKFGNMVYTKSPKYMIEAGEMVPPRIHVVSAKNKTELNLNNLDTDFDAILLTIASAFFAHESVIHQESFDVAKIGAKILVVCRGQEDLKEMFKTKCFDKFRVKYPKIHIFALSSDFGIYNDDEGKIAPPVTSAKKFELLKKIQALTPSDQAIIFHVDMIGEGIDVPGITGVMPFRNCESTKFFQNVGRASRLQIEDRQKLYSGKISVDDRTRWIKPYSWIIIPTVLENTAGFKGRFQAFVTELKNDYGFIPREDILLDNNRGMEDEPPIDTDNKKTKKRKHTHAGDIEFEHEFEKVNIVKEFMRDEEVQKTYEKTLSELDSLI